MHPHSLASKLDLHQVTFAHLANIFTSLPKYVAQGLMYGNDGTSL
jgi:hypothetical protein